jgi:hypothetical protein
VGTILQDSFDFSISPGDPRQRNAQHLLSLECLRMRHVRAQIPQNIHRWSQMIFVDYVGVDFELDAL